LYHSFHFEKINLSLLANLKKNRNVEIFSHFIFNQMLNNHIVSLLNNNFEHEPTFGQIDLINELGNYINDVDQGKVFVLTGYAGTGKTSMVCSLVKTLKTLKLKSLLLAPTGRAAKVMTKYTGQKAFTIHKKIYRQKSSNEGFGKFDLNINKAKDTFFIVDESSMISNQYNEQNSFGSGLLLDDLIEFVESGTRCKLILIGDIAQLPPVQLDVSPALDKDNLRSYYADIMHSNLTDVVRQAESSGILHNATILRNNINSGTEGFFKLSVSGFSDIVRLHGSDLIEELATAYSTDEGIEETIVITRSNKRANRFNQGIRNQILWREEEISSGDMLMVVRNNYHWLANGNDKSDFIANGDTVEITYISKIEEIYGFRFADVTVRMIDYDDKELDVKIMLDTLHSETPSLNYEDSKKLYQSIALDYPEIRSKRAMYEKIRENPYFNALQVKFAYAITCHKAQGGQWNTVFLDHGYLTEEMMNTEFLRWLYTAFTRTKEKLYLINFDKNFFNEDEF
jgi:exodeoxyribonuclease-5